MHTPTPFAALEKRAFSQAAPSTALGHRMAGFGNAVTSKWRSMTGGLRSTAAGLGGLLTGGWNGAQQAANDSWNNNQKAISQADQRYNGHQQAATGLEDAALGKMMRPINSTLSGIGGLFTGGFNGAARAANDRWNKDTNQINQANNEVSQTNKLIGQNTQSPFSSLGPQAAIKPPAPTPQPGAGVMGPPAPGSLAAAPNVPGSGPMMSAVPFTPSTIAAPPKAPPAPQPNTPGNLGTIASGQKF